ncbi:unnamed protein product [Schistosoma bovis]|nr:unnamed protein product [Schistosoma bovis]
MSESIQECLHLYLEDKNVTHVERAFTLLNLASNSWKPGKNFAYTSHDILHLAVVAAEAKLSGTAISVINGFESVFGGNNEFSDLVSLLFAEILFQKSEFSISTIGLAMGHVEKSIYFATESDHQIIINNLLILLYKFVRMKATLFKRAEIPLFLRPKLKLLMDMHIKDYSFILRFGILLIETFIQVGSRKEASQLLDTLAGGVARHVPEQMVELLATASGGNLTSAERYINWALGVYSGNQTELSINQPTKSSVSQAKERNIPMSGPLAHSLISFGIVPSSRLARLRASFSIADYVFFDSTKNPSEQSEEFLKILRLLEIQDENNELITDKQLENKISNIGDSPIDDTNYSSNNTEMINNSEEIIDDVLSPKFLTTETRFKLLVHYHGMQKCYNLLEQCLSSPTYQPETIIQGCLTLWRLCSPLIQHNSQTRLKTFKSLQLINHHLTKQDSLYFRLRCEVHMMIAYCQADMEQITEALDSIDKAMKFDETGEFLSSLNYYKKCLLLRSNLYEIPNEPIEQARQIIERLQNTNNLSSTEIIKLLKYTNYFSNNNNNGDELDEYKRNNFNDLLSTLLIQIGKLVDKSIFEEVFKYETVQYGGSKLLSEYKHKSYKELLSQISSYKQIWLKINERIKHHCEMISENAECEINDKLLVWFDLIKLAKKYQIWDLCSTFCRLCLVFDDDTYWSILLKKLEQYRITRVKPVIGPTTNLKSTDANLTTQTASKTEIQNPLNKSKSNPRTITNYPDIVTSFELKLYSALSQIYCIFAECLCVLLRQQMCGIQLAGNLNNLNPSWFDTSLLINNDSDNHNQDVRKSKEQREYNLQWKNYCEWFSFVNEAALLAFQRSAVLSARIVDSNNLHSCAVCVWNYCLPTICQNDHRQLTTTFSVILENANKIGSSCLPHELYIQMATILAHGLIQPWLPKSLKSTFSADEKNKPVQLNIQQKSQKVIRGKSAKPSFYIAPPEGHPHIKKAIDWLILAGKLCEPNRLDLLQNIDESYQLQPIVPISTRSSLIVCWLIAKQLITNPPVCRSLFPLDLSTETTNYNEMNSTSDSDSQTRKLATTNQKEAQIYLETLITRTLLSVHSLWLTNKHKYISEWPVTVSKLIDEQSTQTLVEPLKQGDTLAGFKDAPTLAEAIHLMQLTFCNQKSYVHTENPTGKSNTIKEQESNIKYDLRLGQASIERFTELELWTRLAMIAFITSQFSSILDIIDMSNIQIELYQGVKQSDVNINYWLIHLLCLRGLAIFGISNQMKLFRQQNLKTSGKYTQQQQQTRGKQRLTDMKFKHVELLGQKRDKSTTSEDSQSIENSLFEAGEEAFYKASNIAHKIGRYDLLVMSAALYWSLLNHSILAPSNQITHVLQKIESFAKKIENITKWLGQCIKTEVRNELAAQIRNSENKQDLTAEFSTLKLESILMDSVKCTKEVSSLYETVIIPYPTVNQFEMDLQLRVDMYKALYNVYSEQGNFTEALSVLAKATTSLPRTKHRMSLFRQLVVTKAKLGQSIELDMQKFTSEPEYLQAQIWIEIAYASSDINVQLMAFKQSVNAIKSPDYWVLKSDLLLQFAQWLFAHGYDMPTCISLAEEAVDILNDLYRKNYDLDQYKETKYSQLIFHSENVQYLDILMRACVLLAEFWDANNTNIEQEHDLHSMDYLIIAVNCVKTILNLAVSSVTESPRLDQKSPKSPRSTSVKVRSKSNEATGSETNRGKQSCNPNYKKIIPDTIIEWSTYELSDDILQAWQKNYTEYQRKSTNLNEFDLENENENSSGLMDIFSVKKQINPLTIRYPLVTMACLDRLLDLITEMGPGQLGYPILVFQDGLVRSWERYDKSSSFANCTCIRKLIHLKSVELSCCLGLSSGVTNHQNKLNSLLPSEQEIADAYTLLKTNPTDPYIKDLIKSWIHLGDRLARIGQCSHARIFLSISEQFILHHNDQMKYWLLARARLALVEGQYKLSRSLISKIFEFNIEDESFWFDCLSIRIDTLCYDPNLTIHDFNLSEINDKQDLMNYTSCPLHYGIQTAIKEIDLAINDLQKRKENFKSRNGWFNKLQGILLSKKAQLITRIDEMNYHYCTIFNLSDKSLTCDLPTRPINLLINPNGAPKLFEEVICLLTSNKRNALRLGWMPLLAYWVRGFKHEVNSHITKLRTKSCHPSTLCNSFETTLTIARQCLNFAYETVKLAESFSTLDELKGCSLPVHRDLIEIKFMLITVLLDMMKLHVIYMRTKLQENTLKNPLYCAVENYISENSSDSLIELSNKCGQSKQQMWDRSIVYAFDEVCSLLSDIFNMSDKQPHLLAKCYFYFGESVYLKGQLILPDLQDNWSPESNDNEVVNFQPIIQNSTFIQEMTKQNLEDITLHSGFRWRTHTDVLNDLKTYNSVMDLFSQASSLFIICLKICLAQNFMGLARQVTESLLNLLGGCHESVSTLTQDLLIGYQSCSTAVRLRTHFWLTILAYDARKCSGGNQCNLNVENEYSDRSILNASEALVRQLMWSSPSCTYDDDSLFTTFGFCSTMEPSSYPEALAWITGLKSNLISNRLRSVGGLCSGSEDHSISASPWIPVILRTLTSQSQAWRVTEVNSSIIFDSSKVLQSTLSSLPGSNLQITKSWNLLIMEHSINSHFLYVAIPKPMNRAVSNRDHRSSIPANKSTFQYTFLRIETDPISKCQLIYSWKKCLNHLDEQLKKAANIKSNNSNLFKQITNQILKIRSDLFQNSIEDIQLFNYLNPIFEILLKYWLPEPDSNNNQNKLDDKLNNNNDPSGIVCQINKLNQLSYQLEQYLNNQSDLSKDGLLIISDFWLNELPLEFYIMNILFNNISSNNYIIIRRHSSIIQKNSTNTIVTPNSMKQNNSPLLKKRNNTMIPFSWLTREFSVQLLYARHQNTHKTDDLSDNTHEQIVQHKTSRKPETTRGISLHPLLRDVGSKQPPLQSCKQQNTGCLLIDTTYVRYLIDPFMDTDIITSINSSNVSEQADNNNRNDFSHDTNLQNDTVVINYSFKNHFQLLLKEPITRSQQFTSRWIGLVGDSELGKVPSEEELLVFLNEGASGLISYITENFLSYSPPSTFINLSIPNCHLICLLDKIYTRTSRLRQIKLNAHKTITEYELEQPLSTAIISSLVGSRSTILLQWSTRLHWNQFRMGKLIKHLLDHVYPIGQSTLLIQYELFKMELDNYLDRLKQIIEDKNNQLLEQKSINEIDYQFDDQYKHLEIPTLEPFNMVIYGLPNISFA